MADLRPSVVFLGSKPIKDLPEDKEKKDQQQPLEEDFIEFFCFRKNLSKNTRICLGVFAFLLLLGLSCLVCYFVLTWQGWFGKEKQTEPAFDISMLYTPSGSKLGVYKTAAVSTDVAPCANIGRDVLLKNGSAVDSAIAMLVCMGALNPHSSGLGGGFIMTIYKRDSGFAEVIDAREVAPAAVTVDMFEGSKNLSQIGGKAVAVPGELRGFEEAHATHGSLAWRELFAPTIELCRKGFPVGRHLAKALNKSRDYVLNEPTLREVFINNETGDLYKENETMTRNDLAHTLEGIAKEGANYLYEKGGVRKAFVNEIREFGGIITEADLEDYIVERRVPTSIKLKSNHTVHSSPVPGSGELLSFMLNVLDGYNLTQSSSWVTLDQVSLTFHKMIESFKFAYAHRMELEDSKDVAVKQIRKNLLDRQYADEARAKIYLDKTMNDPEYYGAKILGQKENHGTAHVSVVAPNGDAVSVTSTVNLYFGAKLRSRSTGIILNNEMDDFSSPNITNYFGVPYTNRNNIRPGRRPLSSMCPTIVTDENGDVVLVVGGNGGTQITSGVALIAAQVLWLEKNIKEAIDMPRIHHQLFPGNVAYEYSFPKQILAQLHKYGHHTEVKEGRMSVIMGIHRAKDRKLHANSDFRKGGGTSGF